MGKDAQYLQSTCPASCSALKFLARSNIENYLDPAIVKAVTGVDCLISHYGKPTDLVGTPFGKGTLKKIKDAGPAIAQQMGAAGIIAHSSGGSGVNSEFVSIFEDIKNAFGL
jgi:hypothetical protein